MKERKLVNCKRCDAKNLYWNQDWNGKWHLVNEFGSPHSCEDGGIKTVKCKYCKTEDLHWAEEIDPITKRKRMILNESYGLPHACDARIAYIAKEKQDKKDKYEAEKKRIYAHPDGPCSSKLIPYHSSFCPVCFGIGHFDQYSRKRMAEIVRIRIWPSFTH